MQTTSIIDFRNYITLYLNIIVSYGPHWMQRSVMLVGPVQIQTSITMDFTLVLEYCVVQ